MFKNLADVKYLIFYWIKQLTLDYVCVGLLVGFQVVLPSKTHWWFIWVCGSTSQSCTI